ncbi:armadillo-type protein [Dipodascopsis uninucleata]
MEDQVEQAVELALSGIADTELKQQAMNFCNQIKDSDDGWQICLSLFVSNNKRSPNVRFFALQVVDDALLKRINNSEGYIDDNSLMFIKNTVMSYIEREYSGQNTTSSDVIFIHNKLAQTLSYIFVLTYPQLWPSIYDELLSLTANGNIAFSNIRGVDFFLRVLLAQHEDIADTLIIRSNDIARRNAYIKDEIRTRDMAKLANVWMEILATWTSQTDGIGTVENCLKVIGTWVSWIDISLIVTPQYMSIIFGILGNERLRGAACDTISEIVGKKMKSADKLELIYLLNFPQTLSQLQLNSDIDFAERVARLVNVVFCDLVKILEEEQFVAKDRAEEVLQQLLPFIISFLANEYDDTSSEVFPAISDYLSFLRKEKRKSQSLSPHRLSTLSEILKTLIMKLKYDDTMDWHDGTDESENEFLEIRTRLRLFQDSIAAIDDVLFMESISNVVMNSLSGDKRNWREVELGLFELGAFSEGLKNASALPTKGQGNSKAVELLYAMLLKMINSNILEINHPSINLQFMELVVKNNKFFETNQQLIPRVLEIFVSRVGIHSTYLQVQVRSWYLFYRFIKSCKILIGDIAETALNAYGDLLIIKAEVAPEKSDGDSEFSAEGPSESGIFETRLYLFEVAGILISIDRVSDEKQINILQSILSPIFRDMENSLYRASEDPQQALQIHHDIMAIGTVARGIVDGGKPITEAVRSEFLMASRAILVSLETLSKLEIIREASRFAFARMVPILGTAILPEIPTLISRLLAESSSSELIDFMSFLGQLIHSFKGQHGVIEMMDQLLTTLLDRVFYSLSMATNGSTDEEIQQNDIKKAYLNFVLSVFNNGMEVVFLSERNRLMLDTIMQSVAHYTSTSGDMSIKKLGSSVYTKLEQFRTKIPL